MVNREDKGELRRQWHIENKKPGYAGRHIPLDCPANNNMGRAMTILIRHSRRQAGIQSGEAAGTRSYISSKQQAPPPCRHSRIKRRGIKAKEFGYAERFNNWIARPIIIWAGQ